jgi:hypothetical protein
MSAPAAKALSFPVNDEIFQSDIKIIKLLRGQSWIG